MCGIAGFLNWPLATGRASSVVSAMARVLAHRGPDGEAIWNSPEGALHFAHRRLAVIDLTETGRQPMVSADGRWTICFNGEVYNFQALRADLEASGTRLRGRSDTEVLLETIARLGLEPALARCEGMFAFALWDGVRRQLHLVRDRVGVKPLYWVKQGNGLAFASELKALRVLPGIRFDLDPTQLDGFLRFGYCAAPATPFVGIFKLPPATILTASADGVIKTQIYWSAWEALARPEDQRSDEDLIDALDALVERAVRLEMVADAPLGCFLSGGVDSSLVAALAQRVSSRSLKTFSVGFEDPEIDESAHARAVADHIGSEHHAIRISAANAAAIVPMLPAMYDEPVADMAQIPTYLVSKLARTEVTVVLSGDGGDELFAGYERYWIAERLWRRISFAPQGVRKMAASVLCATPEPVTAAMASLAQLGMSSARARARFTRLASALEASSHIGAYAATVSLWPDRAALGVSPGSLPQAWAEAKFIDPTRAFRLIDLHTYLPDDVLAKVDRASMAVSLEARVPLLNHRLIEFSLALPARVMRRDGRGKWLLRQVLARYAPRALVERPKQGFSVPMAGWLRGPLKLWADALLAESALAESGLFNPKPIVRRWREHLEGKADWSFALWAVLSFEAWRRHWRDES